MLKGWRTYALGALVVLTGVVAMLADPGIVALHPQAVGIAATVVGGLIILLRTITTTPPGQSGP